MPQTPTERAQVERMIAVGDLAPAARDMPYAEALRQHNEANALPEADDLVEPDFGRP